MNADTQQNRIVITTGSEEGKERFPMNLLVTLAAGAIAGVTIIFGIFWGAEMLFNL